MIDLIKAYARAYKDSAATGNRELPDKLLREIEKLLEEKAGAQADIRRLAAANEALERLCDATYVAQGADAYNHATSELALWQKKRLKDGKDAGCEGSLCDGVSWLRKHVETLEEAITKHQGTT